jgi:hypothetical protein
MEVKNLIHKSNSPEEDKAITISFAPQTETHFTLGVEAKGRGKSRDPIGWELKANPKGFRLGVKAYN